MPKKLIPSLPYIDSKSALTPADVGLREAFVDRAVSLLTSQMCLRTLQTPLLTSQMPLFKSQT